MNTEKLVHGLTTAATGYDVSRHIHHDAVLVICRDSGGGTVKNFYELAIPIGFVGKSMKTK